MASYYNTTVPPVLTPGPSALSPSPFGRRLGEGEGVDEIKTLVKYLPLSTCRREEGNVGRDRWTHERVGEKSLVSMGPPRRGNAVDFELVVHDAGGDIQVPGGILLHPVHALQRLQESLAFDVFE
jgi:hypothetical protein